MVLLEPAQKNVDSKNGGNIFFCLTSLTSSFLRLDYHYELCYHIFLFSLWYKIHHKIFAVKL